MLLICYFTFIDLGLLQRFWNMISLPSMYHWNDFQGEGLSVTFLSFLMNFADLGVSEQNKFCFSRLEQQLPKELQYPYLYAPLCCTLCFIKKKNCKDLQSLHKWPSLTETAPAAAEVPACSSRVYWPGRELYRGILFPCGVLSVACQLSWVRLRNLTARNPTSE